MAAVDLPREPGNFIQDGKKYVVRCYAPGCGDGPRGRENYLPAAASGKCAWCGSDGSPDPQDGGW